MRTRFSVVLLATLALALVPMMASALGLDVEAKGGLGFALGGTDNKDVTGSPRIAAGGGIGFDVYLITVGPIDLGLSTGVEYDYLTTHSTWKNYPLPSPLPPSDQTTDGRYNFLTFPIAVVARYPLSPSLKLFGRVGAFIGYFLNGKYDLSWSPEMPAYGVADTSDNKFNSDNVRNLEYGLHVSAGADIGIMQDLSVSPALQLNMGLTDTTPNNATNGDFNDRLWSLTVMVGIKYKAI